MSTPQAVLPTSEANAPHLSEAERVIDTFIAPSKTFTDIRTNTSWWMPFVLMSVLAILFSYTVGKKIGWDQVMENEIAKSPARAAQIEKMPADQRERMMDLQTKIAEYSGYASPVIILLGAVVMGGILLVVFNFGFGAQIRFKTAMAIVMYSWLPSLVSSLLAVVTMFAGANPEGFNIRNPLATNPAYFMNPVEHKFLYGIASAFDIISLWIILLMAIGFSTNSKVKRGTAFTTIFALFFISKLIGASFAAMF